jgi:hypothetical protein
MAARRIRVRSSLPDDLIKITATSTTPFRCHTALRYALGALKTTAGLRKHFIDVHEAATQ